MFIPVFKTLHQASAFTTERRTQYRCTCENHRWFAEQCTAVRDWRNVPRRTVYSVLRLEECTRGTLYCDQRCTIEVQKNLYCVLRQKKCTRGTLYCDQRCTIEVRKNLYCVLRKTKCTRGTLYCVLRSNKCTRGTLYCDQRCTIEERTNLYNGWPFFVYKRNCPK